MGEQKPLIVQFVVGFKVSLNDLNELFEQVVILHGNEGFHFLAVLFGFHNLHDIQVDGFLFFVGRKKNLIITNNGKNVSPEELEDKLSQRCHAIHEILVSQEGNKIVAEVYPYYEDYGKEADQLIKDAVNQFNRDMPRWKNIDKLEFRSEEFPKTTTLKIRRNYKELEKAGKI